MAKTFRYYTILRPLHERNFDDGTNVLVKVLLHDLGQNVELALLGSESDPRMVRVSIVALEEEPSIDGRKRLDDLAESFLALLQLFYKADLSFAEPRFRYSNFIDDNLPPALDLGIIAKTPQRSLDVGLLTRFMTSSEELRNIVRLYADYMNAYLPIQYRYLSAFKIIEHEFKSSRKKWKPELETLLHQFEDEYRASAISPLKLKTLMISLRDKCAHIKLGNADELSIVGIGSPDTEMVVRFMPLLTKIIQKHVFDTYKM